MSQKHEAKEMYANALYDGPVLIGSAAIAEDKPVEEIIGIVTDCLKLNIRKEPSKDSDVIAVASCLDELRIDTAKSTDDWYAICTVAGIDGYVMKKFVAVTR